MPIDKPKGTINNNEEKLRAIWCAATTTVAKDEDNKVITEKKPTSANIETPTGSPF
jgi:hypothetical protein